MIVRFALKEPIYRYDKVRFEDSDPQHRMIRIKSQNQIPLFKNSSQLLIVCLEILSYESLI